MTPREHIEAAEAAIARIEALAARELSVRELASLAQAHCAVVESQASLRFLQRNERRQAIRNQARHAEEGV